MEHDEIAALRDRHGAWRLLRAHSAPLVLSFLGGWFVEANHGLTPVSELTARLDDELYAANLGADPPVYPRSPAEYLADWSRPEVGWLSATYPEGSDEVHYNATSAVEKAYQWVVGLRRREFVGTESRLHTLVGLLRQIAEGSQGDPAVRLAELERRRAALDAEIDAARAGDVAVLDATALRDRYQQFSGTARELLSDFREVEDNFRALDRAAREQIATWTGSKGDLLAELVGSRSDIASSDQGRSFQAFYDFLLSEARQSELAGLLARVQQLPQIEADRRLRTVHHDWSEAAERAQQTVRQISEQLRRFLDDQVWLENRRVVDLIRAVETAALAVRDDPPAEGFELDEPGIAIALPFERPLYDPSPPAVVDSLIAPTEVDDLDASALFTQRFVDAARLSGNIRAVVPPRQSALLGDILALYPVEHGAAEIVGYLALSDDDISIALDESGETLIDYDDPQGRRRRARLPRVTVSRR